MDEPNGELTEDELAELEQDSMYDQLARKWDPERLLKMVAKRAGKGERLDHTTRQKFEQRLGVDLGHVRVYTGAFAQETAKAHSAEAVTIGSTGMVLMGGVADRSMATTDGQALLAHELTHVAQAERGLHRRGTYGGPSDLAHDNSEAEAEDAEHEEQQAARGGPQRDLAAESASSAELEAKIVDRVVDIFAEDERVRVMRNGHRRFRP